MTKLIQRLTLPIVVIVTSMSMGCEAPPQNRVSPAVYETFFRQAGGTDAFTVTVDLAEAPPTLEPVDVVFVFDVTGSMGGVIEVVRDRAIEILSSIEGLTRNAAVGVASFTDYGSPGEPWRLAQDISEDLGRARGALQGIALRWSINADIPEAYSRALQETLDLSWRPDAKRYVVLFGDAPAHDPTFFGIDLGVDPGRDGVSGTADDLRFAEVIERLRLAGITALVIFDESKRGTLWSRPSPLVEETIKGFEYLATKTGGLVKPVSRAREIPGAIEGALRDSLRLRPALRAPERWDEWVRVSEARPSASRTTFSFDVELRPPQGTSSGIQRFPLIATHAGEVGGAEIGFTGVTIRLGLWSYPWRPLLMLLYPLSLLLALLTWTSGLRNLGRSLPYHRHRPLFRLALRLAAVLLLLLGFYAVWTAAPGTVPPFTR